MTQHRASRLVRAAAPVLALAALLAVVPAARAQQWGESGDAGQIIPQAQTTIGLGPMTGIVGFLEQPYDADVFCIQLTGVPPAGLPIVSLQCVAIMGPNVFLFDAAGNGLFTNETCMGGSKTIVAPNYSLPAGTYYVAVANYGWWPTSNGGSIWQPGVGGQRAPDGPGAGQPHIGWGGMPVVNPINPYQVNLGMMTFCAAPTPAGRPTWGTLKSIYR